MHVFDLGGLTDDRRWIINFPIKGIGVNVAG